MTLRTSLLRQLDNPDLSADSRAELCCQLAKDFENKGQYEEAREVLNSLWPRNSEHPNLVGLEQGVAAEVLLRAGVLVGFIGIDSQEKARNLISESLTIFEGQHYRKKIAEAQAELALCYWRTGEFNEARDLLKDALSRLTTDSELKAKAALRLAIVERRAASHHRALRILTKSTSLFQRINNHTLKGCYHQTLADILENLWESGTSGDYLDRALIDTPPPVITLNKQSTKTIVQTLKTI
jgi:lipopolysaccharide biosynthesis regulator YciM